MMWLLLEAGVAGLLLVSIVWWTLPSKKKDAGPVEPHGNVKPPEDASAKPSPGPSDE